MLERKVYLVSLADGSTRLYDNRSRIAELSNHRVYSIRELNIGEPLTQEQLNLGRLYGLGWVGALTLLGALGFMLFSGITSIKPVRASDSLAIVTSTNSPFIATSEAKDCSTMAFSLKREMCYRGFTKQKFIARSQIPTDPAKIAIAMESIPSLKAYADGDTLLILKESLL